MKVATGAEARELLEKLSPGEAKKLWRRIRMKQRFVALSREEKEDVREQYERGELPTRTIEEE